jgi:two-component system, NarL family, invasion response regulator UvrY
MQPIKVLIVDDEDVIRRATINYLKMFDEIGVVAEARSGEEAIARFADSAPDVTVLDLSMPGMNGFETMRRFLEMDPAAKIVVLSGLATDQHAVASRNAGAREFVAKERMPKDLVPAIHRAGGFK